MKLNVLAFALAASAVGAFGANAQIVIEERRDPAVVIEHDRPDTSVTIEKRDGLLRDREKDDHEGDDRIGRLHVQDGAQRRLNRFEDDSKNQLRLTPHATG